MSDAEKIADLEAQIAGLRNTMQAAADEIREHWDAHCDAEGYGPANLMRRLEEGIPECYGRCPSFKVVEKALAEIAALSAQQRRG